VSLFALAGSLAITSMLANAAPAATASIDEDVALRKAFGFRADEAYVQALGSRADPRASSEYGFLMTEAEAADMVARATFADAVDRDVIPVAKQLDGYGGAWIDQADGGRLVIGFTDPSESSRSTVRAKLPDDSRGVRFEEVDDSAADLKRAVEESEQAWQSWVSASSHRVLRSTTAPIA
jgi:hypothetical protein